MELAIGKIRVGERHRRDLGDIEALAQDIRELGQLQELVVTEDYLLIAGQRRLEALKKLGTETARVYVAKNLDDALKRVKAERSENRLRKEFTPLELLAIGESLAALEKPKAQERLQEGRKKGGKIGGKKAGRGRPPTQTDRVTGKFPVTLSPDPEELEAVAPAMPDDSEPEPETESESKTEDAGNARDKVAESLGISGRTYSKIQQVAKAAKDDPEKFGDLAAEMEATGKVDGPHRKMRQRQKQGDESKPEWSVYDDQAEFRRLFEKRCDRWQEESDKQAMKQFFRQLANEV